MNLIDYAEQQGIANFQWQERVNETTRQEANITLSFLIAGGGASLAWAIAHLAGARPDMPLAWAVIILGTWLFALAAVLIFRCLNFAPSMPPANQPLNVYLPQFNTASIREIGLGHLENAILHSIAKGQLRATWLVRLRYLICLSPLVFLAAFLLLR